MRVGNYVLIYKIKITDLEKFSLININFPLEKANSLTLLITYIEKNKSAAIDMWEYSGNSPKVLQLLGY